MCCPESVKVSDEDASGGKPIFHATQPQLRHVHFRFFSP